MEFPFLRYRHMPHSLAAPTGIAPYFTKWTWPASRQFAPSCSLDRSRCAIIGGSVKLLYFPPRKTPYLTTALVVATTLGRV
jgi:hypothetical protein